MSTLLSSFWYTFWGIILLTALAVCYFVNILLILPVFDPMRKLPGPNYKSLFESHIGLVMK